MAATAQPQQPNGSVPHFKIVERLDSVPVVHDSVAYAQSIINSTQFSANLYQTAAGIATRAYDTAAPVLVRAKPLLESADGVAVAIVDRAEATFPYPFKTPTQDLIGVKQTKAVIDERVLPMIQPVIQEVINKASQVNTELGALQARAAGAIHKSSEMSHELLEQLKTLADQGKEIPHQLLEGLTKVTSDVKEIVLAKDGTVQDKGNKLASYVAEQVKPVVDEIYRHVLGAKKAAVEVADKVTAQAVDAAHLGEKKAKETAAKAEKAVEDNSN